MPAPAPFLPHGRVLGAADGRHGEIARDADVAADTLADVLEAPLGHLSREEGVGDGGPRAADQIDDALLDDGDHAVRRRIAADADDRLRGELLDAFDEGFLPSLLAEAGRLAVVLPAGEANVPEVRDLRDETDHVLGLGLLQPVRAAKLVHREATGNGAAVAHRLLGVDQELLEEPHAVLERAAVFVGAVIELPGEEVMQEAQPVAGIHIDQVVTRSPGAKRRRLVPAADVADVLLVHGARLEGFVGEARNRAPGRRHRHFARIEVGTVQAVITKLQPGERAVRMDVVRHPGEHRDVPIVPEAELDEGRDL